MKAYGLDVVVAEDGIEAIALFKKKTYALVFCDMNLPGANGAEVIDALRLHEKTNNLVRTPVFAFSANVVDELQNELNLEAVEGFIQKPFRRSQMEAVLIKWLQPA